MKRIMIIATMLSLTGGAAALAKGAEPMLRRLLTAQQVADVSPDRRPLPLSNGSFIKRQSEQYNQGNGE